MTAVSGLLSLLAESLMIISLAFYEKETLTETARSRKDSSIIVLVRSLHDFLITVLMVNVQYIPFVSLYPIFLLSGMGFVNASIHWWCACLSICLYTAVYLLFKARDSHTPKPSSKSSVYLRYLCLSLVQALPACITVCIATLSVQYAVPWLIISVCHLFYVSYTYHQYPELSGGRELIEKGLLAPLLLHVDKVVQRFFDGKLLRESPLDAEKIYVFGFHPHGVLPVSLFWLRNSEEWKTLFPQHAFHILTASTLHLLPIMRDLLQWKGGREVSRECFQTVLRDKKNVLVVPGGQTELLLSHSHQKEVQITTKQRALFGLPLRRELTLFLFLALEKTMFW